MRPISPGQGRGSHAISEEISKPSLARTFQYIASVVKDSCPRSCLTGWRRWAVVWGNSWDWLLGTEFAWLETDNPNRCQTKKTMRNKRATISFALFVVVIVLNLYFQMHLVR